MRWAMAPKRRRTAPDVLISRLRAKLGDAGRKAARSGDGGPGIIRTVPNVGYQLAER